MSKEGNIQQHYYARGREGIFRSNEGLDTVAKSPSLDNSFIKKTLHLFCVYHAPQELHQRGERDLSKYPESLTVFTADTGELVIGRGIFAGADFTGQRDSIFVHQYIIPASLKEQAYRSGDPIFRARHFQSEYDGESKSLPELAEIECSKGPDLEEERRTLERLSIDEARFKQLLWAIMMSVSSNKKVYIALNVDISESSLYAKKLLSILYRCLPYGMRRKFGFMTYNHEPQGKKYMNVMFVEKGSIRPGERNVEKDYLFDFANERFMNVEPQGSEHYYLDYVWANREKPEELTAFYEFAEEALQDKDESTQSSLPAYYQLCALYLVEQGSDGLYEANKEAVISGVMSYLDAQNVERKPRLDGLFWKLVEREVSLFGSGYTPSLKYAECMVDYCRIGGVRPTLVVPIVRMLSNGLEYNEDQTYSNQIIQMTLKYGELFQNVMATMLRNEPYTEVVERYVSSRLERVAVMQSLQEEISFWAKHVDEALCTPYVQQLFIGKTKELLAKDQERIKSGRSLNDFLDKQYRNKSDNAKRLQLFYNDLDLQAQKAIVGHTDAELITLTQLEGMKYMLDDESNMLSESLSGKDRSLFQVLKCASFLLRNVNMKEADSYAQLSRLAPKDIDQLQAMLQRLLKGRVRPDSYEKIAYAFYESGSENRDYSFAYSRMLAFVHKETDGGDEMYDFLNWSASYTYFQGLNGNIAADYKVAIQSYFNKTARGALRKRNVWMKLKGAPNESFKQLYKDIKDSQANPIIRFIKQNRKMVIQFGTIVVAVAALTTAAIVSYQIWFQPTVPVQKSPEKDGQTEGDKGPGATSGGQTGNSSGSDNAGNGENSGTTSGPGTSTGNPTSPGTGTGSTGNTGSTISPGTGSGTSSNTGSPTSPGTGTGTSGNSGSTGGTGMGTSSGVTGGERP